MAATAAPLDVKAEEARIRAEATRLAGEPEDVSQRVLFLHEMYVDSGGNFTFPLLAAHGASWAQQWFAKTEGPLRVYAALTRPGNEQARTQLVSEVKAFGHAFLVANRQVFIDCYTNYWLTRKLDDAAQAQGVLEPDLAAALMTVHAARREHAPLSEAQKRTVYRTTFLWEQNHSVAALVTKALESFDDPNRIEDDFIKLIALAPQPHFSYFPLLRHLHFSNFASKRQRIDEGNDAYRLAVRAGWGNVQKALGDYAASEGGSPDQWVARARQVRQHLC